MLAVVWIAVILLSITVHEFSHAYVANLKGDKTAELAGRLTLNPIAHIDPIGMIALLLLGFGWAKPVPMNPYNFKDPVNDAMHVALAGPFSNLLVAVAAGLAIRRLGAAGWLATGSLLPTFLMLLVLVNLFLMLFNLIPLHPLDGSSMLDVVLRKPEHQKLRYNIATYGPRILFILIIASFFTNFNIFFFITEPAYFICNGLTGGMCL